MGARKHFPDYEMARLRLLGDYAPPAAGPPTLGDALHSRAQLRVKCQPPCRRDERLDVLALAQKYGLHQPIGRLGFRCKFCHRLGRVTHHFGH